MPADPEHKPDYIFDGYSLDQNHFIKTDKDGHVCTETAFSTHIYLGKKLRVVIGTANVETDDVQYNEYEFSSVCAEIENFEAQVYKNVKKLARMKLSWDGTECTFPVRHNDIDVDQLCEKLKEKYS